MQTLHLHNSKKNDRLKSFLLFVPILIFGLVILTYLFLKNQQNHQQLASESNPNLGSAQDETRVLGDQDSLDQANTDPIK